jgi:hypothetical protein
MAGHPEERAAMGKRALQKVSQLGGWKDYGDRAYNIYRDLVGHD